MTDYRPSIIRGLVAFFIGVIWLGQAWGQCGCDRQPNACDKVNCGRHHCCHLQPPPQAPVLGSAPAMMAPIVFTPAGPSAVPYANYPRPDQGLAPPCTCNGSNGSGGIPKPPADEISNTSLNQITARLDDIQKALQSLDQTTGKAIEDTNQTLLKTHKALQALEGRIKALGG